MTAPRTLPRVLLTGFAPFDGARQNPSWQAVSRLHGRQVAGHRIVSRELPTEFGTAPRVLRAAIAAVDPQLVVCTGLAAGRTCLSLERIAINVDDARIADNAGAQPVDTPVVRGGRAAYFSTLPVKAMLLALRDAGVPAEVSNSAGTFVCNHVFYALMHALRRRPAVRGGFIHVPCPAAVPAGLDLDRMAEALRVAVRAALLTSRDVRLPAGTEH